MAITAAAVNELRKKTGAGMMDCKKALTEVDGDMEKAVDFLRKKGMASAAKKAGRIAAEGSVTAHVTGNYATIVEVNCETDFVAKNDDFQNFLSDIQEHILEKKPATVEELNEQDFTKTPGTKVSDAISQLIAKIGENIKVRRFNTFEGSDNTSLDSYIHMGGQIGVITEIECESKDVAQKDEVQALTKDLCLHIAAQKPSYLTDSEVPEDVLNKEKEIARDQAKQAGKKEEFLDKIAEGKVRKYFDEHCLLNQGFVKDPNQKVSALVEEVSKKVGSKISIKRFARFELGEGIEKKQEDFAAEVAAQVKG